MFNAKVIMCDAEIMIFNSKIIISNAKFIILNAKFTAGCVARIPTLIKHKTSLQNSSSAESPRKSSSGCGLRYARCLHRVHLHSGTLRVLARPQERAVVVHELLDLDRAARVVVKLVKRDLHVRARHRDPHPAHRARSLSEASREPMVVGVRVRVCAQVERVLKLPRVQLSVPIRVDLEEHLANASNLVRETSPGRGGRWGARGGVPR